MRSSRLAVLLGTLLALPSGARATFYLWNGAAGDTNWYTADNWTPSGLPGPADDVLIPSGSVYVDASSPAISVNLLNLGNGAGAATLHLSTGIVATPTMNVRNKATLLFETTAPVSVANLTVENGGLVTHTGPLALSSATVRIQSDVFVMQLGSTVSVSGKGYGGGFAVQSGSGPGSGFGSTNGADGGGHAQYGGIGYGSGHTGGNLYDDLLDPYDHGSGGGGALAPCYGGAGGGVVRIEATSATLNGYIAADGNSGTTGCLGGGGGGAGGTINVKASYLLGTGTMTVLGGNGANGTNFGGGGGSGGRVVVRVTGENYARVRISSASGNGGTGAGFGTAPTGPGLVIMDPKIWTGDAGDGSTCRNTLNWSGYISPQNGEHVVFGSTNPLSGCFWDIPPAVTVGSVTLRSSYAGNLRVTTNMTVSGRFLIQSGTVTMNANIPLLLGGDLQQTGGRFDLNSGSITFTGPVPQTATLLTGATLYHLNALSGAQVTVASDLALRGNLTAQAGAVVTFPSPTVLWSSGSLTALGTINFAAGHLTLLGGSQLQTLALPSLRNLRISNPFGALIPGGSSMSIVGQVLVDTGTSLNGANMLLNVYGDWQNYGTFNAPGSTLAFIAASGDQNFYAGGALPSLQVAKAAGSLVLRVPVTVAGNLTLSTGTLDLDGLSHTLRGNFAQTGGTLAVAGSTLAFDGTAIQTVTLMPGTSFQNLISSSALSVRLASSVTVQGNLLIARGILDFSTMALHVGGDFRNLGSSQTAANSSTVTLDGTALQTLSLRSGDALDSLVSSNTGAGVLLASTVTLRRNFTVAPGTRFDGGSGVFNLYGSSALWDTAGADYVGSVGHVVRWSSPIYVSAGSTVSAQVLLSTRTTLLGALNIGDGNLSVLSGALLSALSSTITLRGSADILFAPTGTKYLANAASWIVFEGGGTDRAMSISTGPLRNLRFSPASVTDSFKLSTVVVTGHLILEQGTLRSSFTPTIEVQGDFVNSGGVVDLTAATTSTLRMTGAAEQRLELRAGDKLWRYEIASSSVVRLAGAGLSLYDDLVMTTGTLNGGSASIDLQRNWVGGLALFEAASSTVSFSNPAAFTRQTFTDSNHPVFNGLQVSVTTMAFASQFDAAVFTASRPNGLVYFAPGGMHRIYDFRANGGAPATRLRLRCSAPGARWNLQVVSVSTVSSVDVSYSSAPTGATVQANDGLTVDGGENVNWNFLPKLVVVAPGETFTEWAGKSGPPDLQTAGSTFTVTVQAVSDAFGMVRSYSAPVTIESSDIFASGLGVRTLVNGTTTYDVVLRAAEPNPRTTTLSVSGAQTFGIAMSTLSVQPTAFDRLQILLVGEDALPGSPSGKTSVADVQTSGVPFAVIVRAVDRYYNRIAAAPAHVVAVDSLAASSKTLPAPQSLSAGVATLGGAIVYSTGVYSMRAYDATDGTKFSNVSSTFSVFSFNFTSPTVRVSIPPGSLVPTLGGRIAGTAADDVAIARVDVAFRDNRAMLFYDWAAGAFNSAAPVFGKSTLSPPNGRSVIWSIPFSDTKLTEGTSYYAVVRSSNPTGLLANDESTFTFSTSRLAFGAADGQGGGFITPVATAACSALSTATVTFGTGVNGIGPGGMVALHIPEGWTPLAGYTPKTDPALGFVTILSTSLAWTVAGSSEILVNPPSIASATLGANWVVVRVKDGAPNGFKSGEQIRFVYNGYPPSGPGTGPQLFELRTQGGSGGSLLPVSLSPSIYITSGPARLLSFTSYDPVALGPLQTSPTMQLRVTDLCGNPAPATATINAGLMAGVQNAGGFVVDDSAQFYLVGAVPTLGAFIAPGDDTSEPFYYRTSTTGLSGEVVRATATVLNTTAEAARYVTLLVSSATFSGVSVDSGTLAAGATSTLLTVGVPGALAYVRFTLADARVPWDLVLSTDPASYYPPLLAASGMGGAAAQNVSWNGVVCPPGALCRYADPGRYYVRLRAAGADARVLEVRVPTTASIRGRLGSAGADAFVRAEGPGAGPGAFAVASSTGYFIVYGLSAGGRYNVTASTLAAALGQGVYLSTTVSGALATATGTDLGTLALPSPSFIRMSVTIPLPAPYEFWGSVYAHDAGFNGQAFGTLHYSSGSAVSDDGTQATGRSASTWTALALPAGRYDLDVSLFQVGITTTYFAVDLVDGGRSDLNLVMPRRLNVSGRAVLPSTAAAGAWISVQAIREGGRSPGAYASVFIPPPAGAVQPTSAPYTLYGLDPGTWTVQAVSPGWLSTGTTVALSTADVGDPSTGLGGADLPLGWGRVLGGTVSVSGDTRGLGGSDGLPGFAVRVDAYNPATFAHAGATVRLATSAVLASATFSITGLEAGDWRVTAALTGFDKVPPAPELATVPGSGSAAPVTVALTPNSSRVRLQIVLPAVPGCRGAADFKSVGIYMSGPQADLPAAADITALNGTNGVVESFHCSSMTFLSPPMATGLYRFQGVYGPGGQRRELYFPLVNGSTEAAVLDLSAATYTVTGTLALSGPVAFPSAGGYTLAASSPAGITALSSSSAYCLLSSSHPTTLSNFHVELLALDLRGGPAPGPLLRSTASCAAYAVPLGADGPPPLLAYAAAVQADGSFRFDGVPAGSYLLRTPRELDGRADDGEELAEASVAVDVKGPTSVQVPIGVGARVSGLVTLPYSVAPARPVTVRLLDSAGRTARSVLAQFNGERSAAFSFERVGDGDYTLAAEDTGWPRGYAARPAALRVRGADVGDLQVALVLAGSVRGRVAVEIRKADGAREFVLIGAGNRALLPSGLSLQAVAVPWVDGGYFPALAEECGAPPCASVSIDANGQFLIPGVLPGLYDVEAAVPAGAGDGALSLVGDALSGVEVREGQSVDAGTLRLRAALALAGKVRDASTGVPLPNIRVLARPTVSLPGQTTARRSAPETTTASDGSYALEGLDPAVRYYDVVAAPRGEGQPGDYVPAYAQKIAAAVDLASTGTIDFALLAAPYSLSGRVVGAGGLPLKASLGDGTSPGAAVYVQKQGAIPSEGALADVYVRTDDLGSFTVPGLSSGVYRVVFSALGFATLSRTVSLVAGSLDLGTVTLGLGATLSGSLRKSDGTAIGEDEVVSVLAATAGTDDVLSGTLSLDPNTHAVTGYRVGGFRGGTPYRIILIGRDGQTSVPSEAGSVVFSDTTTERSLDLVLRAPRPLVSAKSRRSGGDFLIDFMLSSPLRSRTGVDDDLSLLVGTVAAAGSFVDGEISADRRRVSVTYRPGVSESSFTLRLRGYSSEPDPETLSVSDPGYLQVATFTFYAGVDGYNRANIPNATGGTLALEGDPARVRLPKGAFFVDSSSSVQVSIQRSDSNPGPSGTRVSARGAAAYPEGLRAALAAVPPTVKALSAFYEILLPLGVRTALARPAQLTVQYSTSSNVPALNLYWYNPAANSYVLQQDITGAAPVIDAANRTFTININHFSTFVLFESGVSVITGSAYSGGELTAFNFPNPFDLGSKDVTPIHGNVGQSEFTGVRGTMLRIAVPPDSGGDAVVNIFNVAGERVRRIELGPLSGGQFYYRPWDGRNDAGRDVASGVYIAQVKVGRKAAFFKMALVK